MKVDLITGFLGAGKTTFIKKYREYLRSIGEKIQIIENEFCGYDVDSELLSENGKRPVSLAGECMCCTGKEHFKELLAACAEEGFDRVLVEPSGIYDVSEFFSVMDSEKVHECCETGSILTIFDPAFINEAMRESEELMVSQLLVSGMIIISKAALYDPEDFSKAEAALAGLLSEYGINEEAETDTCRIPVFAKDWDSLEIEDFRAFDGCGFRRSGRHVPKMEHSQVFDTVLLNGKFEDEASFRRKLDLLFNDPQFGNVLRLKGYVTDSERQTRLINCTPAHYDIKEYAKKRGILVLIGNGLKESAVKKLMC